MFENDIRMYKFIEIMKRNYKIIIPIFLLLGFLGYRSFAQNNEEKDKILIALVRDALTQAHYNPVQIDDDFSIKIYKNFIKTLDPAKRYFLEEDIKYFAKYKKDIDNEIKDKRLDFYHIVLQRFIERIKQTKAFYKEQLSKPFNFNIKEELSVNYDSITYAKDEKSLKENWRKQLKLNTLNRLYDKVESENAKKKDSADYTVKKFETLEKEAREEVVKSMKDYYIRMEEMNDEDWFSFYMNTITLAFDPHTTYFSPKNKKKFDINMSGKLEGIGARLQKKGDYTKIVELISGGPAWKAGELEVGDIILKVAQGDKEPVDIVGMRLDDAIEHIKGKKGSEVRLTLKKIDGSTEVISIIRDVVELEETFAKSTTVKYDNKTYGLINLPGFYIDFKKRNARNSATDMEHEIEELKKENIEGLLIDLRNNGGGSLRTAIEIAGMFIKEGPVVQVKYKGEKPRIDKDTDKKIQWNGPLVILVNELSASASEIFAAAMQDYNRAVIIGSKQTFGKGTVQNVLDLDRYYRYSSSLGALKMTVQKFYRINGGSTQLKGVVSDIAVPDKYTYMKFGERDEENPLKWDKIEPANYNALHFYTNFDEVVMKARLRVNENKQFQLINENAKWLKKGQDDKKVFLRFEDYKKDIKNREKESKLFEPLDDYKNELTFNSPRYEIPLIEKDTILAKKREIWHKNLKKDIYIEEALHVVSELKVNKSQLAIKG